MRTLHTLATALLLSLTTVATVAQTSSSRSTLERSLRTYFENYKTGRAGNTVSATLSSLQVDDNASPPTTSSATRNSPPRLSATSTRV